MKLNPTAGNLRCKDKSIHRNQVTSCYINRDTYIDIVVVKYRCLQLRQDANFNIYPSADSCNYPQLPTYVEIFQNLILLSMSMFINNSTFLLYLDISTYDKLHRLIYIEVFPSSCGRIYIHITNSMEINLTRCKLMSGDISIDRKQVSSCYINRNTYIIVEVVEYRCFQLR